MPSFGALLHAVAQQFGDCSQHFPVISLEHFTGQQPINTSDAETAGQTKAALGSRRSTLALVRQCTPTSGWRAADSRHTMSWFALLHLRNQQRVS